MSDIEGEASGTIGPEGEFDDVREVDGPFDEDDIVAWEEDTEVYDVDAHAHES